MNRCKTQQRGRDTENAKKVMTSNIHPQRKMSTPGTLCCVQLNIFLVKIQVENIEEGYSSTDTHSQAILLPWKQRDGGGGHARRQMPELSLSS